MVFNVICWKNTLTEYNVTDAVRLFMNKIQKTLLSEAFQKFIVRVLPLLNNEQTCQTIYLVFGGQVHMTNQDYFVFGLSNINIYNGETNISEYIEQYFHNPTTYGCIEHFFQVYNPLEIIFIYNVEQEIMEGIVKYLALGNTRHYMIDLQETTHELSIQAKNCESQIYQNETMKKFYPGHNIESLSYNLYEKAMGIASFCFLVNFRNA